MGASVTTGLTTQSAKTADSSIQTYAHIWTTVWEFGGSAADVKARVWKIKTGGKQTKCIT